MSACSSDLDPDAAERLLARGRRLYDRCLAKNDRACVAGFVDHQIALGGERLSVLRDYLGWLDGQAADLAAAGDEGEALAHTEALRALVAERLRQATVS